MVSMLVGAAALGVPHTAHTEQYLAPEVFVQQAFAGQPPAP